MRQAAHRAAAALALLAAFACADRDVMGPDGSAESSALLGGSATIPSAVVVFTSEEGIPDAGLDLIASLGGTVTSSFDQIGVVFVSGLTALGLGTLSASDLVEAAAPDRLVDWLPDFVLGAVVSADATAAPAGHDPTSASQFRGWQWGPQRIAADQAWAAGQVGNSSIRVAILDTGIDELHRELRGLVDASASASFVAEEPVYDDLHFHGTHVASTVATNSVTIAGVAPHVTLMAVKVLSFLGSGTFEGVIGGIMHAADHDAHVINMSLGAEFDKKDEGAKALIRAMQRAVQYAGKQGTVVVSAAGNSSIDFDEAGTLVSIPCMVSHICVSATGPLNGQFDENGPVLTDNHDQPAYYTNHGFRAIHVAAPGGNADPDDPDQETWRSEDLIVGACAGRSTVVPQCAINNDLVAFYVFAGGTSMATPHVSATAAMLQAQAGGDMSVDDVVKRILQSADDILDPGPDTYSNKGRINVARALGLK